MDIKNGVVFNSEDDLRKYRERVVRNKKIVTRTAECKKCKKESPLSVVDNNFSPDSEKCPKCGEVIWKQASGRWEGIAVTVYLK